MPFKCRFFDLVVFLPLLGRSFFPHVRNTTSITFQSSFTDPQILGTYFLWIYCLYSIARRPAALRNVSYPALWPFALFTLVAIVSSLLSSNSVMYSLWRSIETTGVLLWGMLALSQTERDGSPRRLFDSFYTMSLVMLMGVIITILQNPEHVWMVEGKGVQRLDVNSTFLMGANSIGVTAALLSLAMVTRFIFFLKIPYLIPLSLFLGLCYAARSRTGFVVFVFGLSVSIIYFMRIPGRRWITAGSMILAVILVAGLIGVSQDFTDSITQTFTRGQDEKNLKSLDGRVSIWASALRAFEQAPILGSGYGTYPPWVAAIGHFHNVFIEVAVTTGTFGLLPILILTLSIIIRLLRLWFRASNETILNQVTMLDALLMGIVLILSDMTTAGAAYYSWQMIGMIVLSVGLHTMHSAHESEEAEEKLCTNRIFSQRLSPL